MKTLVILAAGTGSRLRPLTDDTPKCLLEVAGSPILNRLLDHFDGWADQVIIVTGYLSEKIGSYIEGLSRDLPVKTVYNPDFESTNSLYSAALPMEEWSKSSEVILTNSDVVFTKGSLKPFLVSGHSIDLLVDLKKCDREDMRVSIDKSEGVVTRVSKEIPLVESDGEFTGMAKITRESMATFTGVIKKLLGKEEMAKNGWYDLTFDYIAQNIEPLSFTGTIGHYCEIDTLDDYKEANALIQTV